MKIGTFEVATFPWHLFSGCTHTHHTPSFVTAHVHCIAPQMSFFKILLLTPKVFPS